MATEQEWFEAFKRLERGSSSLRQEAARLGTSKSTVERRFSNYIEQRAKELRTNLAGLISEVSKTEKGLAGLRQEYARREQQEKAKLEEQKQKEEAKLRETLGKQEQEGRRRLERINAEVAAKEKLLPECAKRRVSLEECLKTVEKIGDLNAGISRREKISGQWDEVIFGKQKRHDELGRQIKEKEGHLGELITKLRFAGRLLQHNQAENQQLQGEISRQSAILDLLLNRIKELEGAKTELEALEEKNVDLKKTFDSLEERNAWLKKANAELEDALKICLQKIYKILEAEKQREARVDAEFNERKSEIDRDLEGYIEGAVEKANKLIEEEVRKNAGEIFKRVPILRQQFEELRIRVMALSVQIGEKSGELSTIDRRCEAEKIRPEKQPIWTKQPIYDAKRKIIGYAVAA